MPRFEQLPDENLLDFIRSGQQQAFEALLKRHHRRFFQMVYRWVLDESEAEDIVQQAFLKLWSGKARWKWQKNAKFTTWFYRILYNQSMDVLRQRRYRHVPLSEGLVAGGISPEAQLETAQIQGELHALLQEMPENQRIAVQLFYFEQLKQKEIAAIMGLSVKALESQLTRARQHLKAHLTNPFTQVRHAAL